MTVQTEAHRYTQPLSVSCQACPALSYAGPPSVCSHRADSSSNSGTTPFPNLTGADPSFTKGWSPANTQWRLTQVLELPSPGRRERLLGIPRETHRNPAAECTLRESNTEKVGEARMGRSWTSPRGAPGDKHCSLLEKEGGDKCPERPAGHRDRGWKSCLAQGRQPILPEQRQNQHDARHSWGQKKAGSHQHEDDKG